MLLLMYNVNIPKICHIHRYVCMSLEEEFRQIRLP